MLKLSRYHAREPFFAVALGLAGLSGQGCSATPDAGGEPGAPADTEHVAASAEALTPTMLYSCTDITKPGLYWLGETVKAAPGQPCMQVHSTGPVTLDCRNWEILTTNQASQALLIQNSQNFTIQNCYVGSYPSHNGPIVQIQNSSNGTLTNNSFLQSAVLSDLNELPVVSSNRITFSNNVFYVPLLQTYTTNSNIENNTFYCEATTCNALITSNLGSGNTIAGNTVDGMASTAQTTHSTGTDDAIVLGDESSDNVTGNTLKNLYDCGIEFTGTIEASTFTDNSVTNADLCGIGGWYWFSFYGNLVHGNTVNGAANLFTFMRYFGLRPYNWDGNGRPADTGVYFSENTFDGNSITNPYPTSYSGNSNGLSAYIPFEQSNPPQYMAYNGQTYLPGETVPSASQFYLTGNAFSNNNLGPERAYFGEPAYPGAVIDKGGNVCVKQAFPDFALACGR